MRDERVYHEYASWKMENHELLQYLIENDSDLILRFKHVLDVIDHLYNKLIDDPKYTEEEDHIFETGFYYLVDQMDEIVDLLENTYQNNIKDLEKRAKEVNLLLSTIDFQNELLGFETYDQKDMDLLLKIEEDVLTKLTKKEEIPKEMFEQVDQVTFELFKKLNISFYPINDIFLEIADELGIL